MHVCNYVFIHLCMCICMYAHGMYICMHVTMYVHIFLNVNTCVHYYTYDVHITIMYIFNYVRMYVCK